MARTVNEREFAAKRNEILDVAQRLVYAKGYERMTIQDILAELHISSGAFYHYFATKQTVLAALIVRIQQEAEAELLPIVGAAHLPALEKLQRFFTTFEHAGMAQKAFVAELLPVWFADENAIVREKIYEAITARRAPLLSTIVRQGIQEGVFTTSYPDQAGEIILSIARGLGSSATKLMLLFVQERDEQRFVSGIVALYAAYSDALERMLGAPSGFLHRPGAAAAQAWVHMLSKSD